MKKLIILLVAAILLVSCKEEQKIDVEYVSTKFNESMEKIKKVQYDVRNIMTFSDGNSIDNTGFAIIEKEKKDTIFGFSFYGFMNGINKSAIYRDEIGFQILNEKKSFRQERGGLSFLGSPGGQMIYKDFFKLDTIYKSAELIESENSYIINYTFSDHIEYEQTDIKKSIELDKITFLPKKVTHSFQPDFGGRQSTVFIFDNVKTNDNVTKNISDYIKQLNEFEQIKVKKPKPNKLLNNPLPLISLKNLFNESETIEIKTGQITLLDFWEVWCGHCIESFSKVENLKNKFSSSLNVIGIVSEDKENAIKLVEHKGTTYLNLIGNKELNKTFSITDLPRYFLIDKKGIIQKEYHGFSSQIEKDIQELIDK
jgi:thiol-disulfide isomerase/thioredoxin/outer membrane lipoprotein-sorting protein